jgi:hypothetical protein
MFDAALRVYGVIFWDNFLSGRQLESGCWFWIEAITSFGGGYGEGVRGILNTVISMSLPACRGAFHDAEACGTL